MSTRDRGEPVERGSATVHATVLIGLLTTLALIAASATGLVTAHRRAAAAADLAALAGASALQQGQSGCPVAGRLARANGSRMVGCQRGGEVLTVEVEIAVDSLFGRSFVLRGKARAGPAP